MKFSEANMTFVRESAVDVSAHRESKPSNNTQLRTKDFEVSNCIYTTEYLKLRTGARSDAIEFRRFDGRIVSRQADMLRTLTEHEWHEVDALQLEDYRTKFPAMIQWLTLIGFGKSI